MALTIRDTKTTPRERRWWYPGLNGHEVSSNSYNNLKREVAEHYRGNGQAVPTEQQIIDYLCANLSVPCYDGKEQFRNYYTDPPPVKSGQKPNPSWGILAPIKLLLNETDKGLGDYIARVIGPIGGDAYRKWWKKMTGKDCGCKERQEELNWIFPA